MSSETAPAVVCTLTLGKRERRELAWSDLAELATSHVDLATGVRATFPLSIAEQVEELADKEVDCCGSWLRIEYQRVHEQLQLELTTDNPEGIDLIRSFVRSAS